MRNKTLLGLLGVLGIWITAGLALPFVNVLDMFEPTQLMVFRGFLTAGMAAVVLKGVVWEVDRYTFLIALTLPFATLGLFEGIRSWGAGPTIIIITATPLVNLAIGTFLGRRISPASIVGLVLVLGGVLLARWGGTFQWEGFLWSTFGTVMNGVLYEFFSRALPVLEADTLRDKVRKSMTKCFWACMGMGALGLALSWGEPWSGMSTPGALPLLLGFAFVGGFLYWNANLATFSLLPTTEASVLAQGETPAVILGAYFLLGESLTLLQWVGVVVALYGAWYLSSWLAKQPRVEG